MSVLARPGSRSVVLGIAAGLVSGLTARALASLQLGTGPFLPLMSVSFLAVLPAAMGFVTSYLMERGAPRRPVAWLLAPAIPILLAVAVTIALFLEGTICALMLLPLALITGALGGLVGGWAARRRGRVGQEVLGIVVVLPLVLGTIEARVPAVSTHRSVRNQIEIQAATDRVWKEIARVPPIAPDELPPLWTHRIGFPRPIEATLSREGAGAARHATFERGVSFLETVDTWEPGHRLAFGIRAEAVPPTALDEHVTIGGAFFDVLRGEYVLEPLSGGGTRLVLTSTHRLSTHFNPYAGLWVDAVMSDIQRGILDVIRRRAEAPELAAR